MPTPGAVADRDLLLAALGLQTDLISRDALIAGVTAWARDKARPLGQVLREQGALAADTRDLLETLAEKHLALHGRDAARSLAALTAAPDVAETLRQIRDPDVQANLTRLTSVPWESAPRAAPTPGPAAPSATGPRYRVLRAHAEGGLGKVFVARDEELGREVALKEIKPQYADHPDSRSRFLLEAEVTGGLEHPGIVPVYGLGAYPDGRPYYAMRFIKGDDLKDAIQRFHEADTSGRDPGERSLALRQLLRRFVDVCNAVGYAHSRGVLHRDLKPGNVMLGKYGETLVVDWGLAKAVGRTGPDRFGPELTLRPDAAGAVTATHAGAAVGTPAYMSPEQADGCVDSLGPASDIYGLGAILYNLLTGQTPVRGQTVLEVLVKVKCGEVVPPRQAKPSVPPALEAVCLKALALKPEDRYASALDLGADVEHWLADEPVSAWREPPRERARRWVRRHQALVAGATAAVLVAVAALAVGVAVVSFAFRNEQRARQAEQAARESAEANEQRALDNERQAKENEQRALEAERQAKANERRALDAEQKANASLTLALNAYKELVFGVQEKMRDLPGALEVRKALLDKAVAGLDQLAREGGGAAAEHTTAAAHLALGDVLDQFDGQAGKAHEAYQRAHQLFKNLAAAEPKNVWAEYNLALSLNRLGKISLQLGQVQPALGYFQDALDRLQRLAAADPKNALVRLEWSVSLERLGNVSLQMGQRAEALRHYQQVLDLRQKLAADDPKSASAQRNLSVALEKMGDVSRQLGQRAQATRYYQEALEIDKKRAAAAPGNVEALFDVSVSCAKLGYAYKDGAEYGSARQWFEEALAVVRPLEQGGRLSQRQLAGVREAKQQFDFCRAAERALASLDEALKQPKELVPQLLRIRLAAMARQGQHAELALAADALAGLEPRNGHNLYFAACAHGVAASAAKEDATKQQQYVARAMALLAEARMAGHFKDRKNVERLKQEPDMAALRERDDFKKLLAELEREPTRP